MNLKDLFVSYNLVEPVTFIHNTVSIPKPIYFNLERVLKASQLPIENAKPEEDISNWQVLTDGVIKLADQSTSKKWQSSYKNQKSKWVYDMTLAYKKAGLSDNMTKNLIAKNALESGWGNYAQGDYNFGNITAGSSWKGKVVQGGDHNEFGKKISQKFRAYNSLDDFVQDEIQLLTNLYDITPNDDFDTFINKLQGNNKGNRRYAEDRNYINKVRQAYNSI